MVRILKTALLATAVSGTLDLLSAFIFSAMDGGTPLAVLRSVASGPFGNGMRDSGPTGALTGLATHYSIMFVMALTFALIASRWEMLLRRPLLAGIGYGLGLYLFMYWIVLPQRWPAIFPKTTAWSVGNALFSHIICVGIPMALVTAAMLRNRARPAQ